MHGSGFLKSRFIFPSFLQCFWKSCFCLENKITKKTSSIDFRTLPNFHRSVNPVCISTKGLRFQFEFLINENEIIPKSDASKLLFQSSNLDSNKTENGKSMLISTKFFFWKFINVLLLHQPVTKYQISFFVLCKSKKKNGKQTKYFELWQNNNNKKWHLISGLWCNERNKSLNLFWFRDLP